MINNFHSYFFDIHKEKTDAIPFDSMINSELFGEPGGSIFGKQSSDNSSFFSNKYLKADDFVGDCKWENKRNEFSMTDYSVDNLTNQMNGINIYGGNENKPLISKNKDNTRKCQFQLNSTREMNLFDKLNMFDAYHDQFKIGFNYDKKVNSKLYVTYGRPSKHNDYFNMKTHNGLLLSNLAQKLNISIINNIENCKKFMRDVKKLNILSANTYLSESEFKAVCKIYKLDDNKKCRETTKMDNKMQQISENNIMAIQDQANVNTACLKSQGRSYRYKTELCIKYFYEAACKYHVKCQFAHGYDELNVIPRHPNYKTQYCKSFYEVGFCPYGYRCHFIHNEEERTNLDSPPSSLSSQSSFSSKNSDFSLFNFKRNTPN
ncbi:hypothetical protein A3Q56_03477 [Intoshia linei]|uniref:C3H1-type domain-containing protein n=1 Tax=Intoshia linei TaxID=1819745 RepID=A0A177B3D5_9BILA|nr:hypothetical protein A3Q56_03477 [Intoshia linei]